MRRGFATIGWLGPAATLAAALALTGCPSDDDDTTPADDDDATPADDDDDEGTPDPARCDEDDVVALRGEHVHASIQEALDAGPTTSRVEICPGVHDLDAPLTITGGRHVTLAAAAGEGDPAATVLDGGGATRLLHADEAGRLTLHDLTFRNAAVTSDDGGAVRARVDELAVARCAFTDNEADGGGNGGAIAVTATTSVSVSETTFAGNTGFDGGAFHAGTRGGPLAVTFAGTTWTGNGSTSFGGAFAVVGQHRATLDVTGSLFTANTTGYGGAVIHVYGPELSLEASFADTTFEGNASDYGAGVANFDWEGPEPSSITFTDCELLDNNGGDFIGTVSLEGPLVDTEVAFVRTTIDGNVSNENASALDALPTVGPMVLRFEDCTVTNNVSTDGAAVYTSGPVTVISESTDWGVGFTNNHPADLQGDECLVLDLGEDETFTYEATSEDCP